MKIYEVAFFITLLFTFIFISFFCMVGGVKFTAFSYFTVIIISISASTLVGMFVKWYYPNT